jgi:hypothetical protein
VILRSRAVGILGGTDCTVSLRQLPIGPRSGAASAAAQMRAATRRPMAAHAHDRNVYPSSAVRRPSRGLASLAKRSVSVARWPENGRDTTTREEFGGIAEMLSRFGASADRHRWPDEFTGYCQSFPPCAFPGRTTSASRRVRSARHAPIDGLSRVSARRSGVGTPSSRYDARDVKPSSDRATSCRTGRRGLLRRLAGRTRPNDDAVTRVIDRKCAAFQELRHANQWIRRSVPREIVAETFHRPCNRPATTRPPTCKNA